MVMEKNLILIVNYYLSGNIKIEKNGMEKDKTKKVILNLK